MTASLYLLLAISVVFIVVVGAAFWWAIFSGQFDDAGEAGRSVLLDDDRTHTGKTDSMTATEGEHDDGRRTDDHH